MVPLALDAGHSPGLRTGRYLGVTFALMVTMKCQHNLVNGIVDATVVEEYEDPGEQPAVLLLQRDSTGTPLHVVWGFHADSGDALVITAYYPGLDRWEPDLVTRRRR